MKTTLIGLALLTAGIAHAGITDGLGVWHGSGAVFDNKGQETTTFTVELERTSPAAGVVEAVGKVTLASGDIIPLRQKTTARGNGFRLETPRGTGGGFCYGGGICSSYEDQGDGKGRATVIIVDGPDTLRLLITELDHDMPVRFIRQSLTRSR